MRETGSDLVWSFTGPVPSGYWLRRMAHETLVHRADALRPTEDMICESQLMIVRKRSLVQIGGFADMPKQLLDSRLFVRHGRLGDGDDLHEAA